MNLLTFVTLALATTSASDLYGAAENPLNKSLIRKRRIVNGNTASFGRFSYQVGLSLCLNEFAFRWLGGSLIGNQWVLTAAHIAADAQYALVYLGGIQRAQADVTYNVSRKHFIIHHGYNVTTGSDDICLIKIPWVQMSHQIQLVKLPTEGSSQSDYFGKYAIASGWGWISDSRKPITDTLKWARFQVISNNACKATYSHLTYSYMCVSTTINGAYPCHGDSGGPLILESTGVLIGVISFGSSLGCSKGYPVAFVCVANYLDWIYSNTGIWY